MKLSNSISARNPQSNAILEKVHHIMGNAICAFSMNNIEMEDESPLERIYFWHHTVCDAYYLAV